MKVLYIEDCLNLLVSENTYSPQFKLDKQDIVFLNSINSQVNKGLALTERQYTAVVEKCYYYKDLFSANEIDLDNSVGNVKNEFREIDRRKEITIEDIEELKGPAIRIRFPFSKKQIITVQSIKDNLHHNEYFHKKGSHEHFFKLTPKTLAYINKYYNFNGFQVQSEVTDLLDNVKEIVNNKEQYVPGVYNFEVKNFQEIAKKYIDQRLGTPNRNNLYKFYDRRKLYGIEYFDEGHVEESISACSYITERLIKRHYPTIWNRDQRAEHIFDSLKELDRYPIFILLPHGKEHDYLQQSHNAVKDYIKTEDISVMFRLDNTNKNNTDFNEYIKINKLNNPLAKNTKLVYTNTKITRPTLESNILPEAWVSFCSDRAPLDFTKYMTQCDLIIYNVEEMSPFNIFGYKHYDII